MIICVDFDGTCVAEDFPYIGNDIGAVPVLKELNKNGHKIILNTIRDKQYLQAAIRWFKDNGIELYGINSNPTQIKFSTSPKIYCDLYIDDRNLGCPLITDKTISDVPFVDWKTVRKNLVKLGYIK